mgnify:CR=1 FL=1
MRLVVHLGGESSPHRQGGGGRCRHVCVAFCAAGSFNACLASFVTFGPLEADCYLSWHLVLLIVTDTSLTRGAHVDVLGLHVAMQPGLQPCDRTRQCARAPVVSTQWGNKHHCITMARQQLAVARTGVPCILGTSAGFVCAFEGCSNIYLVMFWVWAQVH